MNKPAPCFLVNKIHPADQAIITSSAHVYMERGMNETDAYAKATQDVIDVLENQRARIEREAIDAYTKAYPDATKRILDGKRGEVSESISEPESEPIAEPIKQELSAEEKAKQDLDDALSDIGDIFGKNFRASITPEQEQKLMPVLTRLFDAAFRLGYHKFKAAAKFALDTLRAKFGDEVADAITLDHLQGSYIGMAGRYKEQGADSKKDVVAYDSIKELLADPKADIAAAAHEAASSPLNDKPAPTKAQAEAGSYAKGHITLHGMDISIENPEGSERTNLDVAALMDAGTGLIGPARTALYAAQGMAREGRMGDAAAQFMQASEEARKAGKEKQADALRKALDDVWISTLPQGVHYGDIKRTTGADGDAVDVFVGPNPELETAYIINQRQPLEAAPGSEKAVFDEHKVGLGFKSADEFVAAYLLSFEGKFGAKVFQSVSEPLTIEELKEQLPSLHKAKPVKAAETPEFLAPQKIVDGKYVTDAPETSYKNKQGAVIPGVIAKDLSAEEAKSVDPLAWKNNGGYFIRMEHVARPKGESNVADQRGNTDLERDRGNAGTQVGMGEAGIPPEPGTDGGIGGSGVSSPAEAEDSASGGERVPGPETAAAGTQGDFSPFAEKPGTGELFAGDQLNLGSGDTSLNGPTLEPAGTEATDRAAQGGLDLAAKRLAQAKARSVPVISGDRANISESLPFLMEGQKDDVSFAETRFAKPDGYGVLFTNGTGTGKTYTAAGIIKRFERQGKTNILIVVPSDKIANDWIDAGKNLKLDISALKNTQDAGKGIVITTYANMGANNALVNRKWDLVVADESHYMMQAKDGGSTLALDNLRAITMHPRGQYERHSRLYDEEIARLKELQDKIRANIKVMNLDDTMDQMIRSIQEENKKYQAEADKLVSFLRETQEQVKADVDAAQGINRTRAVFLSATPFAYEKTVDYAEGYLFDYGPQNTSNSYNSGQAFDQFMMQHFGYRMRYNKLTEPGPEVNRGLMQRQFNSWLKSEKVLSGRMLDVEHDYDRKFILVDSAIGAELDRAMQWIWDRAYDQHNPNKEGYSALQSTLSDKFDHLTRRYLLEAIKAKEAIPIIRAHLDMGRKVVVFHDFKKGGGFNPVRFRMANTEAAQDDRQRASMQAWNSAVEAFNAEFSGLIESPMWNAASPIDALSAAFPDALLFNGDVPAKKRRENATLFNDDDSGKNLIIGQSAAMKEGVSLHDTTGKHPRVLINLGLPTQPTTAIQQEGRIFRVGQASNAMFRYLNTGTNWERFAFATSVAQRASAAENLAVGEEARALMDAFIEGFEESDTYPAGHDGEGTGGKARDKAANQALTDWDRAMTLYWAQQKKTSRTKAAEGVDYFATPEPLGLKMVEWADIRDGDKALEPSAGHGAIARWLPDNIARTVVEPSTELSSRLKMVMMGDGVRLLQEQFEQLDTAANKYDAIVMNPPFGSGGATAIQHVAKAAKHLNNGGRIVALIPTGPAADKKFDKWFYEEEPRAVKPLDTLDYGIGPQEIYRGDTVKTRASWAQEATILRKHPSGGYWVKVEGQPGETTVTMESVIAVARTGPRTETHRPAENLYLRADITLPQVTFERAGTRVAARIVVIEKQTDKDAAGQIHQVNWDFSGAEDIKDFFYTIKEAGVGPRATVAQAAQPASTPAQTAQAVQGVMSGFKLAQTRHAIKGIDLYVATIDKHVEYDEYKRIEKIAKQHGGYYSKFKGNGAIPGFQFEKEADRAAFLDEFRPSLNQPWGFYEDYADSAEAFNSLPDELRRADDIPNRVIAIEDEDVRVDAGWRGVSILANGVAQDFAESSVAQLVGSQVENSHDLAAVAQIYRDPRLETARYFFIKDGVIVGQTGVSSRKPGSSQALIGRSQAEQDAHLVEMARQARAAGADSVWMLHNHPSGDPTPSPQDMELTGALSNGFENSGLNFLGHVIINQNQFAALETKQENGKTVITGNVIKKDFGQQAQYDIKHPKQSHPLLGQKIEGPDDVALNAKQAQVSPGQVVIIGVSGTSGIRVIAEVTPSQLSRPQMMRTLRQLGQQTGSDRLFAYGLTPEYFEDAQYAIQHGLLVDAIIVDGGQESSTVGYTGDRPLDGYTLGTKDTGYVVSMPVWHGTPHTWAPEPGFPHGRPRLDKQGTGEGGGVPGAGAAYGYGFYSAEAKEVGASYRNTLAGRDGTPEGYAAHILATYNGSIEKARKYLTDILPPKGETTFNGESRELVQGAIDALDSGEYKKADNGSLYQLDIPDDVLPYLLDFDAEISEQSPTILAALGVKKPSNLKGIPKSVARDVQFVSDTLKTEAVRSKGFGALNVDARSQVVNAVLRASENDKVFDTIVSLLPVDVMNFLAREKITPEVLFHNKAVLSDFLSSDKKNFVTSGVEGVVKSHTDVLASLATEMGLRGLLPTEIPGKDISAGRAGMLSKHVPIIIDMGQNATANELYSRLASKLGSDKAASEYLASLGIVGNRYLDQQSRNGTDTPTYNFVIWDQPTLDKIALLERNGEKLDAMREADAKLSRSNQAPDRPHTPTSLKSALEQAYQNQFIDALLGTGNVEIVTMAQAKNLLRPGALSSVSAANAVYEVISPDGKYLGKRELSDQQARDMRNKGYELRYDGTRAHAAMFSVSGLQSEYEVQPDATINQSLDGARLKAIRRAALDLEAPERGITFRIDDQGRAIVTGPARTKVPTRFQRFAGEHGLTLVVRRGPVDNITTRNDGEHEYGEPFTKRLNAAMPIENRESGALYFGEIGNGPGEGGAWLDRTGKTRFSQNGIPQAFYLNGKTYLIADAISQSTTSQELRALLRHEIGVHAMHLGRDDAEFKAILNTMELMRKAGNQDVIAAYDRAIQAEKLPERRDYETDAEHEVALRNVGYPIRADFTKQDDYDAAVKARNVWLDSIRPEEMLAYAIQAQPDSTLAKRFMAWFKRMVNKVLGAAGAHWNYTLEDLNAMAEAALLGYPQTMARGKWAGSMVGELAMGSQSAPMWFSPLNRMVLGAKQDSMPAGQWTLWLQSNKSKFGVKDDELQFSGVLDYLALRGKDKVTKAEIADYLAGNGVVVEDVVKGADQDWAVWNPMEREEYYFSTENEARDYANENDIPSVEVFPKTDRTDSTKFGPGSRQHHWEQSYKGGIPGTYREILVTLPRAGTGIVFDYEQAEDGLWELFNARTGEKVRSYQREGDAEFAAEQANRQEQEKTQFKSGHWQEPNVLVHLRLDEVTGADGKRYVRVGEVQGDWPQAYRKQREAIGKSVDGNFQAIVDRMKADGVLKVEC